MNVNRQNGFITRGLVILICINYCIMVKNENLTQHIVNITSGEKMKLLKNIVSSTGSRLNIIAYSESDESIISSTYYNFQVLFHI